MPHARRANADRDHQPAFDRHCSLRDASVAMGAARSTAKGRGREPQRDFRQQALARNPPPTTHGRPRATRTLMQACPSVATGVARSAAKGRGRAPQRDLRRQTLARNPPPTTHGRRPGSTYRRTHAHANATPSHKSHPGQSHTHTTAQAHRPTNSQTHKLTHSRRVRIASSRSAFFRAFARISAPWASIVNRRELRGGGGGSYRRVQAARWIGDPRANPQSANSLCSKCTRGPKPWPAWPGAWQKARQKGRGREQ